MVEMYQCTPTGPMFKPVSAAEAARAAAIRRAEQFDRARKTTQLQPAPSDPEEEEAEVVFLDDEDEGDDAGSSLLPVPVGSKREREREPEPEPRQGPKLGPVKENPFRPPTPVVDLTADDDVFEILVSEGPRVVPKIPTIPNVQPVEDVQPQQLTARAGKGLKSKGQLPGPKGHPKPKRKQSKAPMSVDQRGMGMAEGVGEGRMGMGEGGMGMGMAEGVDVGDGGSAPAVEPKPKRVAAPKHPRVVWDADRTTARIVVPPGTPPQVVANMLAQAIADHPSTIVKASVEDDKEAPKPNIFKAALATVAEASGLTPVDTALVHPQVQPPLLCRLYEAEGRPTVGSVLRAWTQATEQRPRHGLAAYTKVKTALQVPIADLATATMDQGLKLLNAVAFLETMGLLAQCPSRAVVDPKALTKTADYGSVYKTVEIPGPEGGKPVNQKVYPDWALPLFAYLPSVWLDMVAPDPARPKTAFDTLPATYKAFVKTTRGFAPLQYCIGLRPAPVSAMTNAQELCRQEWLGHLQPLQARLQEVLRGIDADAARAAYVGANPMTVGPTGYEELDALLAAIAKDAPEYESLNPLHEAAREAKKAFDKAVALFTRVRSEANKQGTAKPFETYKAAEAAFKGGVFDIGIARSTVRELLGDFVQTVIESMGGDLVRAGSWFDRVFHLPGGPPRYTAADLEARGTVDDLLDAEVRTRGKARTFTRRQVIDEVAADYEDRKSSGTDDATTMPFDLFYDPGTAWSCLVQHFKFAAAAKSAPEGDVLEAEQDVFEAEAEGDEDEAEAGEVEYEAEVEGDEHEAEAEAGEVEYEAEEVEHEAEGNEYEDGGREEYEAGEGAGGEAEPYEHVPEGDGFADDHDHDLEPPLVGGMITTEDAEGGPSQAMEEEEEGVDGAAGAAAVGGVVP